MSGAPSQRATQVVLAILGGVCAIALWRVFAAMGLQVPLDPNEGWNAYHTAAAMHGRPLYPGPEAYLVNNYPPLSYYVVGVAGLLIGDAIVAGRIVSFLAFAVVLAGMVISARRMKASPTATVMPPLLFAACLLLFTDYVGMDDPQMLAHAVAMGGFVVVLTTPRRLSTMASAALLFVLAFFIKHAVVAMAASTTLWLLLQDRRNGLRLAGFGLAFLAMGLLLFRLIYGVNLLSVVSTARLYSYDALWQGLKSWSYWSLLPIVGLIWLLITRWRDPAVQLCAIYAFIATATGAVFLGGAGVDPNVLFDADIALALSAGLVLHEMQHWKAPVIAAAFAAPLVFFAASNEEWQNAYLQWHPMRNEAAIAKADIAFMTGREGPSLCEMLSFCYWAGKPPAVDFFNVGQQFDTGTRSDADLVRAVEAKRFAVIQFDPDSPYSLGENIHVAMEHAYRVHHSDEFGTFYVPR